MNFHKNKYLTTVAAAALALAVGACGSGSDDDDMMSGGPPPVIDPEAPGPEIPAPLTELEKAQADAAAAALAAMTASGEAATAAEAAMAAVANLATMQTNATAGGLAYEAHTAAGKAMMAYMDAKKASEDAAEAEEVTAAVEARILAEAAMDDAVDYAKTASDKGTEAETAAMAELIIDGTDKNVGGSSLNADDPSSVVTTDGDTVATGRLEEGMQPMHSVIARAGEVGVNGTPDLDTNAYVAPVAGVAASTLPIGKLVDSADDMARLMIVTQYAGSKTVKVYSEGTTQTASGTKAGFVSIMTDADGDDETNNVALKSEGTYYPAGTTDGTLEVQGGLTAGDVPGPNGDFVATDAKGKEVFSYTDPDVTTKTYVVLRDEVKAGTTTTYNYVNADIHVEVDRDGADADTYGNMHEVTAKIPEATDYKHIHYGVWAALGDPEKDGTHELSDLGIGFVQNFSGEGLTSIGGTSDDMPNGGDATYKGNWVAAVQAADEDGNGAISLVNNAATLEADFSMGEITATLTGLADLTGDIAGNTFSGDEAMVPATNMYSLGTGKFTGTFSGGFYGAKAVEAGGIFDFTSEDAEDGAFRGAFGGKKE